MDDDGFVFIVDRIKDMIITGGENVYSAEVENARRAAPGGRRVRRHRHSRRQVGRGVHAVVVPRPGANLTAEAVIAHCRALIAGYKCPRTVEFRDDAAARCPAPARSSSPSCASRSGRATRDGSIETRSAFALISAGARVGDPIARGAGVICEPGTQPPAPAGRPTISLSKVKANAGPVAQQPAARHRRSLPNQLDSLAPTSWSMPASAGGPPSPVPRGKLPYGRPWSFFDEACLLNPEALEGLAPGAPGGRVTREARPPRRPARVWLGCVLVTVGYRLLQSAPPPATPA